MWGKCQTPYTDFLSVFMQSFFLTVSFFRSQLSPLYGTTINSRGDDKMKIERTFVGNESFLKLFLPLIEAEIDRIMEQLSDYQYTEVNANTSHSERVA